MTRAVTNGLVVKDLTHRYGGALAIDDVSFSAAPGEIVALLGPSGCGKSTVLRSIAGLIRPHSGDILLGERSLTAVPARERGIGMVFQNYALFPHMTVEENIAYPLAFRGLDRDSRRKRVGELLATVQLEGLARRLPRQLSGGQQQRVAVARALAVDPALLLLDEPFAALDRALRLDLQIELVRLQRALGITTIIVTHDQEEAQALANRMVVMNRGRIEQAGSPTDIYDHPASLFVNGFVGVAARIRAKVTSVSERGSVLTTTSGETLRLPHRLSFTAGAPVIITARPERLSIVDAAGDATLSGHLLLSTPLGPNFIHSFALADGTEIKITEPRDRRSTALDSSVSHFIALDVDNLHVFPPDVLPAGEAH